MKDNTPNPQINASKLRVGGEIVGAIFAIGTMLIFLTGIPVLRYIFLVAVVLGCIFAVVLRFIPHSNPGRPWLISAIDMKTEVPPYREREEHPGRATRIVAVPVATHV